MARAIDVDHLPRADLVPPPEPFWQAHREQLAIESELEMVTDPATIDDLCLRRLAAQARQHRDLQILRRGRWTDHPLMRVVHRGDAP